jgi:hypothetical protein
MQAGWKLNPHWRLYFEMKREAWRRRCWEAMRMEQQLQALHHEAEHLVAVAAHEAQHSKGTRH